MIADAATASVRATPAGLYAFLDEIGARHGGVDVVNIFHAVRCLPYLSTGDRTLEAVLARRAGSCSGKHILLAALLDMLGIAATVELVEGDFATPLRHAHGLPKAFEAAIEAGIPDIHNVVRAEVDGRSVVLDATWHDGVKRFGFRVNDGWTGTGDTEIAVDVVRVIGPAADPAAAKAKIIAGWPASVQIERRRFLEAINAFVDRIEKRRDVNDMPLGGDRNEQDDERLHRD